MLLSGFRFNYWVYRFRGPVEDLKLRVVVSIEEAAGVPLVRSASFACPCSATCSSQLHVVENWVILGNWQNKPSPGLTVVRTGAFFSLQHQRRVFSGSATLEPCSVP